MVLGSTVNEEGRLSVPPRATFGSGCEHDDALEEAMGLQAKFKTRKDIETRKSIVPCEKLWVTKATVKSCE